MRALLLVYHAGRVLPPMAAPGAAAARCDSGPTTRAQKRARLDLVQRLQAEARTAAATAGAPADREGQQRQAGRPMRRSGSSRPSAQPTAAAAKHIGGSDAGLAGSGASGDGTAGAAAAAGGPRSALARRPALATMPPELLMHIIGLAAYPVSAWI